jgi:5S rRNA maturation endonuclease (ribonuclease M5)
LSEYFREKQEKIQEILQCLKEESALGIPIVVEGKNDVETLRALGVSGHIVTAKTAGKTRLDLLSEINHRNRIFWRH